MAVDGGGATGKPGGGVSLAEDTNVVEELSVGDEDCVTLDFREDFFL